MDYGTGKVDVHDATKSLHLIANEMESKHGRYGVTADLIVNHLWQWLADHPGKLERAAEEGDWVRRIGRFLRREAHYASMVVKGRHTGIPHYVSFFYSESAVDRALPSIFTESGWG